MRRAGETVRVAQGLLVVRAPDGAHPSIGSELIDDQLTEVGRVVDVFGPVDRPYLAVTPAEDVEPAALIGERLYERESDLGGSKP